MKLKKSVVLFFLISLSVFSQEQKMTPAEIAQFKSKIEKETKKEEQKGLWTIFIIAFFSGFAALLTPCVFPMIPMTVSFFLKQSAHGDKNAEPMLAVLNTLNYAGDPL